MERRGHLYMALHGRAKGAHVPLQRVVVLRNVQVRLESAMVLSTPEQTAFSIPLPRGPSRMG